MLLNRSGEQHAASFPLMRRSGLFWKDSVARLPSLNYVVGKGLLPACIAFLGAGKNGLTRDTLRDASTSEVQHLKAENNDLKKAVAELTLDVIRYKKSLGM
jgi:hypothetical protein